MPLEIQASSNLKGAGAGASVDSCRWLATGGGRVNDGSPPSGQSGKG